MSNEQEAPSEVVDGEWESAVQRISDKLRAGAAGTGQSQLAEELVRLEQRALEAEETLARERHAYTGRVREMEEKLRKLEPWLRKLKTQFQSVSEERDRLNDRLSRLEENTQLGLDADREANDRAIQATIAERDAAMRELEALRHSHESRVGEVQGVWEQRLREATEERDSLQREVAAAGAKLRDAARAAQELATVQSLVGDLETTLAAERSAAQEALRRAKLAGEAVQDERRRAEDAADAARSRSEELSQLEAALQRARDEASTAQRACEQAQAQAEDARRRIGEAEAEVGSLRGAVDQQRTLAETRANEAGSAREELDQLQCTIEKLRAETAEAKQTAAKLADETEFARRTHESLRGELEEKKAALEAATAEASRLARDLADSATRTEELRGTVEQVRTESNEAMQQAAARLASVESERDAERASLRGAEDRLRDLEVDVADLRRRAETAESALADVRSTLASQEAENAGLARTLTDERTANAERVSALEETHASQLEAQRAQGDAEALRLRRDLENVRTQLSDVEAQADREAALHAEASARLRDGIASLVTDTMRRLGGGVQELVGHSVGFDASPLPTAPADMDDAAEPMPEFVGNEAGGEWDQLLTNLEALRSEVEDFRPEALLPDTELHSFDALDAADGEAGPADAAPDATASILEHTDDLIGVDLVGTQTIEISRGDPRLSTPAPTEELLSDTSVSMPPEADLPTAPPAPAAGAPSDDADDLDDGAKPETEPPKKKKNRRRTRRSR